MGSILFSNGIIVLYWILDRAILFGYLSRKLNSNFVHYEFTFGLAPLFFTRDVSLTITIGLMRIHKDSEIWNIWSVSLTVSLPCERKRCHYCLSLHDLLYKKMILVFFVEHQILRCLLHSVKRNIFLRLSRVLLNQSFQLALHTYYWTTNFS